jgi:hypothetical protein
MTVLNKESDMSLDRATVELLKAEAYDNYYTNQQEFVDSDCCVSMHAAESWLNAAQWLASKLEEDK